MRDIKTPYQNSKYNRELAKKVIEFERDTYASYEEEKTEFLEGKPFIKSKPRSDIDSDLGEDKSYIKYIFIGTVLVLTAILYYLATYVFNRATLVIENRVDNVEVKDSIVFNNDDYDSYFNNEISKEKRASIDKTGSKTVKTKASGSLTIYNNFGEKSQRLVKNTRFIDSKGNIFRINESVTIPGKQGDTPGQITVKVSADSYGSSYNIEPSDFKIPGFKNSPRYEGFYAKSFDNMSGGADGTVNVYDEKLIDAKITELSQIVDKQVRDSLSSSSKANYMVLKDTLAVKITDNKNDLLSGNADELIVTARGSITEINTKALSKEIGKRNISQFNTADNVMINSFDTFDFTVATNTNSTNTLTIYASGSGKLSWILDFNEIKKILLGRNESEVQGILSRVSGIRSVIIESKFPLWGHTLPKEESKINIKSLTK